MCIDRHRFSKSQRFDTDTYHPGPFQHEQGAKSSSNRPRWAASANPLVTRGTRNRRPQLQLTGRIPPNRQRREWRNRCSRCQPADSRSTQAGRRNPAQTAGSKLIQTATPPSILRQDQIRMTHAKKLPAAFRSTLSGAIDETHAAANRPDFILIGYHVYLAGRTGARRSNSNLEPRSARWWCRLAAKPLQILRFSWPGSTKRRGSERQYRENSSPKRD